MIYCDTSLLVAALTVEPDSAKVRDWLGVHEAGTLCISPWVLTEFSSAIALKVRSGALPPEEASVHLANWNSFRRDYLANVPVPDAAYALAAALCDRHVQGLRAPDALHVAIASLGEHQLATLDIRMAEGAVAAGVATITL